MPLFVRKGNGPNLLGRNLLQKVRISWKNLFQLKEDRGTSAKVGKPIDKYKEIFLEELGIFSGPQAKIDVAENAQPKYFQARPGPYELKEKIENESDRLVEGGTVDPLQFANWTAPIVPIVSKTCRSESVESTR